MVNNHTSKLEEKMNHKMKNKNGKTKGKQVNQLSDVKIEQLSKQPIIENTIDKAKMANG